MSDGLRLLVVGLRYPPHVAGGYEQIAEELVEGLRGRGHAVHVLCGRSRRLEGREGLLPWLEPRIDGDENLFERSHRGGNLERLRLHVHSRANAAATRRALRAVRPQVLLHVNLGLASIAPLAAARRAGVPRLGLICDPWPLNHWLRDWRARGGKPLRLRVLTAAWRAWRRRVGLGRLLVASESLRRELVDDGLDPRSLVLLPLALPPSIEDAAFEAPPPRRAEGERLVCLCTSSHWEGKGLHVLLDAAARAAERGADLELVLVGDGDPAYRRRLEELARHPALAGRVRFTGRLPQPDLVPLLRAAHLFVFPSVWPEPFGRVSIEAMAFGVALVASDAGGIGEQFVDGESGLAVPPGDADALADALVALAADEPRRRALGAAARAHADRHHRFAPFLAAVEAQARALAEGAAE